MKTKNQKKIKEIKEISQTTHNQIKIPQVNTKQLQKELQITKQNLQQKLMTLDQQIYNETTDTETKLKLRDEYENTKDYLKDITMAYNEIQSINKKLDEITTSCIYKVDSCNCLYVQFLFQKLCSFLVNI